MVARRVFPGDLHSGVTSKIYAGWQQRIAFAIDLHSGVIVDMYIRQNQRITFPGDLQSRVMLNMHTRWQHRECFLVISSQVLFTGWMPYENNFTSYFHSGDIPKIYTRWQ